jgi:hypothetical protein
MSKEITFSEAIELMKQGQICVCDDKRYKIIGEELYYEDNILDFNAWRVSCLGISYFLRRTWTLEESPKCWLDQYLKDNRLAVLPYQAGLKDGATAAIKEAISLVDSSMAKCLAIAELKMLVNIKD